MGADEFGAESLGAEEHVRILREEAEAKAMKDFIANEQELLRKCATGLCGKADFGGRPIVGTLFEEELRKLINKYSVENALDMPDFILAAMICRMIEAMGPKIKQTLDWHGCNSVCHTHRTFSEESS